MSNSSKSTNGTLPIGTILRSSQKEYRVEALLGMGGFGITYRVSSETEATIKVGNIVQNQVVKVKFAVKEFFMRGCDRDTDGQTMRFASTLEGEVKQSLQDFITEAKRLNYLGTQSKNIVKVNEVFEANDTAYYVMEYLEDGSVADMVTKNGAMSWEEAKSIICPIAQAVSLLHEEKLLHMDIKPDNIMLKHDAKGNLIPVLIDFGIAKHFDANGNPTSHYMAKGASDGYAPVEQYLGITEFAPKIDVYALGATMLFMLIGKQPPKADNVSSTTVVKLLPDSISASQKLVVAKAMAPSKFERTPNVPAFLRSIATAKKKSEEKKSIATKKINLPKDETTKLEDKKSTPKYLVILLTCAFIAVVICLGYFMTRSSKQDNETVSTDPTTVIKDTARTKQTATESCQNQEFTNSKNIKFTYTGTMKNGTPNGKGKGVYDNGTYEGYYVDGLRQGEGIFSTNDGQNYYSGMFDHDLYDNGTLTLANGMYFTGTFHKGQPYTGTWYNKDKTVNCKINKGE